MVKNLLQAVDAGCVAAQLRPVICDSYLGCNHHSSGGDADLGPVMQKRMLASGRRLRRASGSVFVRLCS